MRVVRGLWPTWNTPRKHWSHLKFHTLWPFNFLMMQVYEMSSLTNDKVGSSMNCFKLRLFPLTWTGKKITSFTDPYTTQYKTEWMTCMYVCVLWPEGVCRSCGGRHIHCLLIAEIQTHTGEIKDNSDVKSLLIYWIVFWTTWFTSTHYNVYNTQLKHLTSI